MADVYCQAIRKALSYTITAPSKCWLNLIVQFMRIMMQDHSFAAIDPKLTGCACLLSINSSRPYYSQDYLGDLLASRKTRQIR
ncbi:unnamed protein product [Fusarium graminearum]|uniref:Chromosome 2, complete genome n=2 Tax=Gibberella zeae TaxID=5518 RepID=A0A0E0S0X4_GIBZE|nr:hypothetical protein FG05_30204 [Fusarium graminearum]CAF3499288.1 unnamed protein product [Fusarium graminearum]CAF3598780.1 unnamed protein product [Fusarium graminearum]CAG1975356.1 unnamed protein product [Fusarium graminearum]CAG2013280.1 unnamed protein product [Fusarium graminearum]